MGRKDKKNPNPALKAKKEAKAEKAVQKRLRKECGINSTEDCGEQQQNQDFDSIISSFTELDVGHPIVERMVGFPSPRANFSLSVLPSNSDILMFGGEYFNGAENVVYDDLFQWSPEGKSCCQEDSSSSDDDEGNIRNDHGKGKRGEWRRIYCPSPKPKPRCAHSAVVYNGDMYIFGGELATVEQFHHYRDFWKYNPKSHLWTQVEPRTPGPSARSGHRCIVWRHFMILFGGFYEALRETPRWFNDLWVYDFFENLWTEYKYSKLTSMPDARSGFVFALHNTTSDTAFLYGGFSKVKNPGEISEGKVHTDCWTLHLKPILSDGGVPAWNRISRKGEYPSIRSSMSGVSYKHRLLVVGGVFDEERDHHVVQSLFYDDMFALDMEKRRWFKINLKKQFPTNKKSRRKNKDRGDGEEMTLTNIDESKDDFEDDDDDDDEEENSESVENTEVKSSGWGLEELRACIFVDEGGNGTKLAESYNKDMEPGEESQLNSSFRADINKQQSVDVANNTITAVPKTQHGVIPLPRIKPALVIRNNTLFLYGGLLEVGSREVTLDDMWSLDLQKREQWVCLFEGSMNQHAWKGEESDGESNFSSSVNDDGNVSDDEEDEEDCTPEDTNEGLVGINPNRLNNDARRSRESECQNTEIDHLKIELNKKCRDCTPPLMNESLADFYARTSQFWTHQAFTKGVSCKEETSKDTQVSEKEIKKIGFNLAREKFLEVKPIVERIREMTLQVESDRKVKKKETAVHLVKQDRKHRAK